MLPPIKLYNRLSGRIETFKPILDQQVSYYLCGPTVYDLPHMGHARSALFGDLLYRVFTHWGYRVHYVRNITDVGHLTEEQGGERDKIDLAAKKEALDPMVVAEKYMASYLDAIRALNCFPPTLSPRATGHITEQISFVEELLKKGFAYEVNGSVYFDLKRYTEQKDHLYGQLSGQKIDAQRAGSRRLSKREEKRFPLDFALWKKASPDHLMRWPSPWGMGFPGWHLECSAMSRKYLGLPFDIHIGGIDLSFPHHECEIIQNHAATGRATAHYFLHHNMVTLQQEKMSKSKAHFISLEQCFRGSSSWLSKPYTPMVVRFFLLSAHYRTVLDCSASALDSAQKGYHKLYSSYRKLKLLIQDQNRGQRCVEEQDGGVSSAPYAGGTKEQGRGITQDGGKAEGGEEKIAQSAIRIPDRPGVPSASLLKTDLIAQICSRFYLALAQDFNTPQAIAALFDLSKVINALDFGVLLTQHERQAFEQMGNTYLVGFEDILGFKPDLPTSGEQLLEAMIKLYRQAKAEQNYALVDQMRALLAKRGIALQDGKKAVLWSYQDLLS